MTEQHEPLTPPDCDLRDFQFMPLDVIRLFGSRFHAIADDSEWRCGVTLWLKSFHQVPSASLPDDDVELCRLAELGRDMKAWKRYREVALHGWIKCSDGRLYHPVVAEKANEAWNRKLIQRERSRKGNAKRWGSRVDYADESSLHEGEDDKQKNNPRHIPEGIPEGLQEGVPKGILEGVPQRSQGTGTGIVKEKDKAANTNPRVSGASNSPPPDPQPIPRTVEMATLLRKHGAAVTHANPPLLAWSELGVTDSQLLLALDLAKRRRLESGSHQPVNAGFLDSILKGEVLREKPEKPSRHHGISSTDFREGVTEDGRF